MDQELNEREKKARREEAVRQAWASGRLLYKLDSNQRKCYNKIEEMGRGSFYFNKARRVGGSYLLTVRAVEQCLRKPNAQVRYAAPTTKALRQIVQPNLRKVLSDCPSSLRRLIKWSTLDQQYRFPNGSTLSLAGCDAQRYEDLRGTEANEIYMDEVGFIDELRYIMDDVLMPQIQDTGGKVILISTPARSMAHESVKIAMAHKQTGRYFECTVWDNPRHTKEEHEAFFSDLAKGMPLEKFYKTSTFRREYLAEFIPDAERSVIPEWDREKQFECVREVEPPERYDSYVGIDLGWRDGSAFVLGYWDYPNARLVITDEHLVFRTPLDAFQHDCEKIEVKRLGHMRRPLIRAVDDNDRLAIEELNRRGWYCRMAAKKDKEVAINQLRELIRDGRFILHPRCVKLNAQLLGTIWNENRTSYERNEDGHGDLLDALLYLSRAVLKFKDPLADREPHSNFEVFKAWEKEETGHKGLHRILNEQWLPN